MYLYMYDAQLWPVGDAKISCQFSFPTSSHLTPENVQSMTLANRSPAFRLCIVGISS